jgi:hypothetical protein
MPFRAIPLCGKKPVSLDTDHPEFEFSELLQSTAARKGRRLSMYRSIESKLISRRRAFSLLGLAAVSTIIAPATVIITTDAEARVGNPASAVSIAGVNRRDRRRDRRYKKKPAAAQDKKTPGSTGEKK